MRLVPSLSSPVIFTSAELQARPDITTKTILLANISFRQSKLPDPARWHIPPDPQASLRFPNPDALYKMLGTDGIMAFIFDDNPSASEGLDEEAAINHVPVTIPSRILGDCGCGSTGSLIRTNGRVVACVAAVPWRSQGLPGEVIKATGAEEGWEIKAVCVDGDARYRKRGLAVQLLEFVEQRLCKQPQMRDLDKDGINETNAASKEAGTLTLWILIAESINGAYWRKRGYREIRRQTCGEGVWGCKTTFEMLVLQKNVRCLA